MIQYIKNTTDLLPLFSYQISQYMIKSLLFRKQGKVDKTENSAMITWGPSLLLGGVFSDEIGMILKEQLQNQKNTRFIYAPDGEWKSYVENITFGKLENKQIHLYKHNNLVESNCLTENLFIFEITKDWLQSDQSNLIKNEIYSYLSVDDFLQNGYGLTLVIDGKVCGYCLSEYSIDNECAINIWVDEHYRRLGYAKMMTQIFLHHGKSKGRQIYWGCTSDNIPSNKLAQATGFTLSSRLKYYEWQPI
ncbi:MAG: GNAT family N-acetyltransferase [Lachnospiraceae bacterium]|nr:GNAT family N-acetyltransferase [Lachnospiraceae bacterium]